MLTRGLAAGVNGGGGKVGAWTGTQAELQRRVDSVGSEAMRRVTMGTYNPPVAGLLTLGHPQRFRKSKLDYTAFGIGPQYIPELMHLFRDAELTTAPEAAEKEKADDRTFDEVSDEQFEEEFDEGPDKRNRSGTRRFTPGGHSANFASEAVEPFLDLLAAQEGENWDDWVTEELPVVLGRFGPSVIPAVVARLEQRGRQEWPPVYFAQRADRGRQAHPESRAEVIAQLCRVLDTAAENEPGVNGSIVSDLIDLKATEAWPTIECAYGTGNVDETVTGSLADVKHYLGLGPAPVRPLDSPLRPRGSAPSAPVQTRSSGSTSASARKSSRRSNRRRSGSSSSRSGTPLASRQDGFPFRRVSI